MLLVVIVIAVTIVIDSLILTSLINDPNKNTGINDQTIPASGLVYVRGLEVYGGDLKSQLGKNYIDWGELDPRASCAVSFYVKSTSTEDVELRLEVTGWTPIGLGSFIDVFWDHNGTILSPHQELLVTVTLSVSSSGDFIDYLIENQVQTFNFDMIIYASGI